MVLVFFLFVCSYPCFAAKPKATGTLQVFSELDNVYIYLDGSLKGEDSFIKDGIQVGEHYVKVVKKETKEILFSKIVEIKKNEVKTILVTASKPPETLPPPVTSTTSTILSTGETTTTGSSSTTTTLGQREQLLGLPVTVEAVKGGSGEVTVPQTPTKETSAEEKARQTGLRR